MANVTKLLHNAPGSVDFLSQLRLTETEDLTLKKGREKVRNALRTTFASAGRQLIGRVLVPRFFTQGSYAYKTLNRPAWPPAQKMDLDDGSYLPLSFVKGAKPSIAAEAFFKVVDASLIALAQREGWRFEPKPTCSRVIITSNAKIDIPLYATPDAKFEELLKAVEARAAFAEAVDFMDARRQVADTWELLPSDEVLLAHRESGWQVSDPREIHEWFLEAIELFGEQLRRVCRYLKAWRDHHHPRIKDIPSIVLMVCVWKVYVEIGHRNMPSRDDLALLKVAERLPALLEGPVENPSNDAVPPERLDARITDDDRREAIALAKVLRETLRLTVEGCYLADVAVANMRDLFGERIPNRPDLVSIEAAAKAEVMSRAPAIVAAPNVGRSISG